MISNLPGFTQSMALVISLSVNDGLAHTLTFCSLIAHPVIFPSTLPQLFRLMTGN